MIDCQFEDGGKANLRHSVIDAILLNNKGQILLVKRSERLINGGKFALAGGFIDRNENSREACMREIKEETGYESEIQFLLRIADNPDRPQEDRQNIAFIYVALAGEKIEGADDENTEVGWFDLNKLPPKDEFAFDHFENIQLYLDYNKYKFDLPVIGKI